MFGVRSSSLTTESQPPELDDGAVVPSDDQRALEDALESVRERFGSDAVGSAAFMDRGRLRPGRRAGLWGPEDGPDPAAPTLEDHQEEER